MFAALSIELIKFIDTFIFPGEENTTVVVILMTITWESARFIRIKSIQENFIISAYIVQYTSDYTNSQFSDNI